MLGILFLEGNTNLHNKICTLKRQPNYLINKFIIQLYFF